MDSTSSGPLVSDSVIPDLDEFCKHSLGSLIQVVRASHALPKSGDDHEFYSSYSGFQEFVSYQKERLLKNISTLMKNNGFKDNFASSGSQDLGDVDDYMDRLIECNDGMLERVSALLDVCEGKKQAQDMVINIDNSGETSENPQTVVSSWNKTNKHGKSKTFKLLHAHNILRPQLKFKDHVDNTNTPFVPKIRVKPNALRPLPKALLDIDSSNSDNKSGTAPAIASLIRLARNEKQEDLSIYRHPYHYELSVWEPTAEQLEKVDPVKPSELDQDNCIFISTPSELDQLMSALRRVKEVAVDLEHHSYRTFQGITCLMQISTRDQDYIVDTLALRAELPVLNEVFTDPEVVKVFHGADSDVVWLQRDFGVYIVNMFDTGLASRTLSLPRHSLDFLGHHYCGVNFDKKYQLADWRVRPLTKEMLFYAQGDTHYLLYIYDVMKSQLIDQSEGEARLLRHVLNRSRDLCMVRYEKPLFNGESHLSLLERNKRRGNKNNKLQTPQQREALRVLYEWRDTMARQEDESPGYILPNHMLLQIAEILPREAQGVLACCNPIPPLLRQHVVAVHQLVSDARMTTRAPANANGDPKHVEVVSAMPVPAKVDDDYANLLSCPHDLSREGDKRKSSTFNVKPPKPTRALGQSSLLGPFNVRSLSVDDVSLFKHGLVRCAVTSASTKSTSQDKKSKILEQFSWDPFAFFFPPTGPQIDLKSSTASDGPDAPLTLKRMLSGDFKWKMCKLTLQEEEEEENVSEKPKEFGKIVEIPKEAKRDTEEQVQVLKQMVRTKKRKKATAEATTFASSAVTFAGLPQAFLPTPPPHAALPANPSLCTPQFPNQRLQNALLPTPPLSTALFSKHSPGPGSAKVNEPSHKGFTQGQRKRGKKGNNKGSHSDRETKPHGHHKKPFVAHKYSDDDFRQFQKRGGGKKRKLR